MKKIWILLLAMSRTVALACLGILIVIGLMFFDLKSLTPGISEAEVNTYHGSSSLSAIGDNIMNAPYKLAVFVATSIFDTTFGLRFTGAMVGTACVIIFFLLVRRMFSMNIAIATSFMFTTSTLLLAMARTATPQIMLLSLLFIVAAGFYLRFGKRTDIGWIVSAAVIGLSMYVPGMMFFILAAAIWQLKAVRRALDHIRTPYVIAAAVIFGLLCIPLFVSLIREPGLWRNLVGLPEQTATLQEMASFVGRNIVSLFAFSQAGVAYWLGRQPVLDIFASVMFVYGVYALIKQRRLERPWMIGGIFLLGLIWTGVTTNQYGLLLLLPFVYMVIGFGIQELAKRWFTVFPKNPIARYCGAGLIGVAVILSVNFQAHRYYVAWPNHDTTKQLYRYQLSDIR